MNLAESIKDIDQLCHLLNEADIHHTIGHSDGTTMIDIFQPKERWEVSIASDGTTEVEVFKSDDNIYDESKLLELMSRYYCSDIQSSGCGCNCKTK